MPCLCTAYYKMLNKIKQDPDKLGGISCSWTGTFENDNTPKKCLQIPCFDSKIVTEITKRVLENTLFHFTTDYKATVITTM